MFLYQCLLWRQNNGSAKICIDRVSVKIFFIPAFGWVGNFVGGCGKLLALVPSGILPLNWMVLISFEVIKRKLFYPSENTKNLFWHWLFFLTSKSSLSMVGILTEQFPGLFYTNAFEKLIPKTCSRIACHPTGSVRKTAATAFVVFLSRRLQLPRFSDFCNPWVENLFDLNNTFRPERDLILS